LYRHPSSVFVADFIGTSTILRGYADSVGLWHTQGLPTLKVGDAYANAIAIALRPEDAKVVARTDVSAKLEGTIGSVFFQGDHALAQVLVGEQQFLVAIRDGELPERGAHVALTWNDQALIPLITE